MGWRAVVLGFPPEALLVGADGFLMNKSLMNAWLDAPWGARVASLVLWVAASACGADGAGLAPDCSFGACDFFDASSDGAGGAANGDASAPAAEAGASDGAEIGSHRSPLCAVSGCFPGNAQACVSVFPSDAGGDEPSNPALDVPDAGDEDSDNAEDAVVPDAGAVAIEAAVSDDGAFSAVEAAIPDSAGIGQSCYVYPLSGGGVTAACAQVGSGSAGSACRDSSDCGLGLACVQVDGAGVCRAFSCGLPPSCPPDPPHYFYQLAPLMVAGVATTSTVPVCVPTTPCDLLTTPSVCTGGKVCAVVGNDGDTSCVTPGTAKRDEWCDESTPCAEGLVCAMRPDKTQNRCLQLCHVEQDAPDQGVSECPGGTCQGGNMALPMSFGICVGDTPDGG